MKLAPRPACSRSSARGARSVGILASGTVLAQVELPGGGNLVRATVTFLPKFRDSVGSETAPALSATVAARPMTMKHEDAAIP